MAGSTKTLSVYLNLKSKAFQSGLGRMQKSMKKFGQSMTRMGANMTRNITMPLALIGGAAIKLASDFETSMTKIQTLVGLPASEVANLREEVLSLAGRTAQAPKELADGLYFLTSAGLDSESAMKALESVSKAVASGMGEQTDLAKVAAAAQNAYGEEVVSASDALDIFGKMIQTGMFEASELANVLGTQLGLAANLGIEMEEVGAMISTYTRTTGDATAATNGLSATMMAFAKITPKQEKALKKIGMTSESVREMLGEQGLQKTLLHLAGAFEKQGMPLSDFFSKSQALKGVLGVLGTQTESYTEILNEMGNSAGFVDSAFDTTSETSAFKFQQAMVDLKVAGTELGATLIPIITKITEKFSGFVKRFSNLSGEAKEKIVMVGGAVALLGPAFMVIGTIISGLAGLVPMIGTIVSAITAAAGAISLPLLSAVAIIAVVAGAIALLAYNIYKDWDKVKVQLAKVINYFIDLYNESMFFRHVVESTKATFKSLYDYVVFAIEGMGNGFKLIGGLLTNIFNPEERKKAWDEYKKSMLEGFDDLYTDVSNNLDDYKKNMRDKTPVPEITEEDIQEFVDNGVEMGEGLVATIKEKVSGIGSQFKDWIGSKFNFGDLFSGGGGGTEPKEGEKTGVEGKGIIVAPNIEESLSLWEQLAIGIEEIFGLVQVSAEELAGATTDAFGVMQTTSKEGFKAVKKAVVAAVRETVQAKLVEAIAGYAASVFKSVPFPFNIGLAAASGAVVGQLFNAVMPPVKGLAEGGLAFGASLAMVGEGRGTSISNPEVIAPLDRLQDYMGNGKLHGSISGSNILLSNSRSTNSQDRVSGSVANF